MKRTKFSVKTHHKVWIEKGLKDKTSKELKALGSITMHLLSSKEIMEEMEKAFKSKKYKDLVK